MKGVDTSMKTGRLSTRPPTPRPDVSTAPGSWTVSGTETVFRAALAKGKGLQAAPLPAGRRRGSVPVRLYRIHAHASPAHGGISPASASVSASASPATATDRGSVAGSHIPRTAVSTPALFTSQPPPGSSLSLAATLPAAAVSSRPPSPHLPARWSRHAAPASPLRTGSSMPLPSALAHTLGDLLGLTAPLASSSTAASTSTCTSSSSGRISVKTPEAPLLTLRRSACCVAGSSSEGAVLQLWCGTGASTDDRSHSPVRSSACKAPGVPSIPEGVAAQSLLKYEAPAATQRTAARRPPTFLVALAPFGGADRDELSLVPATLHKSLVRGADGARAPVQPATPHPTHGERGDNGLNHVHPDTLASPPSGTNSFSTASGNSSPQAPGPSRRRVRVSLRLHSLPQALTPAAIPAAAGLNVVGYDVFLSAGGRHVLLLLHTAAAANDAAAPGATAAVEAASRPAASAKGLSAAAAAGVEELEEGELVQEQELDQEGSAVLPAAVEDVEMEASEDEDAGLPQGAATPPLPHRLQLRTALSSPPSFSGWGSVITAGPAAAAAAPGAAAAGAAAAAAAAEVGAGASIGTALAAVRVGDKRPSDADGADAIDSEVRRQRACVRDPNGSSGTKGAASDGERRRSSSSGGPPAAAAAAVEGGVTLSPMPSPAAHRDEAEAEAAADARAAAMHIDIANSAGAAGVDAGSTEDVDAAAAAIMRSPRCVPEAALLGVAALRTAQAEAAELRAELEAARHAQRAAEGTAHRLRGEMRTRLGMERMALQRIEEILESQQAALRQAEARAREAGEAAELLRQQLAVETEARAAAERRVWEFRSLAERALRI